MQTMHKRSSNNLKYGITIDVFEKMGKDQKSRCKICNRDFKFEKDVQVDHNHGTGKVRALLCLNCNVALGHIRENIGLGIKILRYINDNTDSIPEMSDIEDLG